MTNTKKIARKILLSTIVCSSAIIAGSSIASYAISNNSVSTNMGNSTNTINNEVNDTKISETSTKASHQVDYNKHTIDGVQLRLADSNLEYGGNNWATGWKVYTNADTSGLFPAARPNYVMIAPDPSAGPQYKYLSNPGPSWEIIDNNPDARHFAIVNNNPTPGTNVMLDTSLWSKRGSDGFGTNIGGDSYGNRMKYKVGNMPKINGVKIGGTQEYWEDESFNLTATPSFDLQPGPLPERMTYEWYKVVDGVAIVIDGQRTANLTAKIPALKVNQRLQIRCKATFNGTNVTSTYYDITVKRNALTNLNITIPGSNGTTLEIKDGDIITVNSSFEVNHGAKPDANCLDYQWYLRDTKTGKEERIPDQTNWRLIWKPSLYNSGKEIILKASWNGSEAVSNPLLLVVKAETKPEKPVDPSNPVIPPDPTNPLPEIPGDDNVDVIVEETGTPTWVWIVVGVVVVIVAAVVAFLVWFFLKNKKEEEKKKQMLKVKPGTPGNNPRLALPSSSKPGPMGPNGKPMGSNVPRPGANGPGGPRPGSVGPGPNGKPPIPGARPGVSGPTLPFHLL